MKRSKRYKEAKQKIEAGKLYPLEEAIQKLRETGTTKFDAAVELHVRLNIDPKQSDQMVRGTIVLPSGTGKTKKVAAFVMPDKEQEAREAGADMILGQEEIEKIAQTQKVDFDIAVATPDMMRNLGKVAKILGQKGLMPNPRTETIGPNIGALIKALKGGKIAFKADETGNVHQMVGRMSFEDTKLQENILTMMEAIRRARPDGVKGTFIQKMVLTSSMGPAIPLAF